MTQHNDIKLFESKKVRTIWYDKEEKMYLTDVTDAQQLLRLIQAIPSPKAEPFKQWLAQVATERLDQMQDPELSINQALADYKRLGYSDNWINQRLKSIEICKDLTDEWKRHGLKEGVHFATLTHNKYLYMRFLFIYFIGILFVNCGQQSRKNFHVSEKQTITTNQPGIKFARNEGYLFMYKGITMSIELDTAKSQSGIIIQITNKSGERISTGENFRIDLFDGGIWVVVPLHYAFYDIGYDIANGKSRSFYINLQTDKHRYESGKYRVVKEVNIEGEGDVCLEAEFYITAK